MSCSRTVSPSTNTPDGWNRRARRSWIGTARPARGDAHARDAWGVIVGQRLRDGARGCIVGGAVADALGGPAEGLTPAQIHGGYGGWITGFGGVVESTAGTRIPPLRKGAGRVTY